MRAFVLTSGKQLTFASILAVCALWMGICTAAMMVNAMALSATDQEIARTQAKYERWIADRQARLNSAVAQLNAANGSVDDLALTIEKRHAALAMLLTDVKGAPGLTQALAPTIQRAGRVPPGDRPDAAHRIGSRQPRAADRRRRQLRQEPGGPPAPRLPPRRPDPDLLHAQGRVAGLFADRG